jgi:hypothetical protein
MTRAAQVAHAVKAMREARAASSADLPAAPLKFLIFEDNGGGYYWTIVTGGGKTLVRAGSLGSYEEARRAADIVRRGASGASFDERFGDRALAALPAPVDATAPDRMDAERWLDEDGSFSSEAVTR